MKAKDIKTEWHDPDDAPELGEDFFAQANEFVGDKLIRRGRPALQNPKKLITLRVDSDVLAAYRAMGSGWQTQVNAVLRRAMPA